MTEKSKQNEFEKQVEEAMAEIVKQHQHNHPLYQPTRITDHKIDCDAKQAAFILFEQIDTDRLSAASEGWLGDQFRYSVWHMKEGEKPKQLYEDHAYKRDTKSALTGSKGRDCSISLVDIVEDGVIAKIFPQGVEEGSCYRDEKVKITLDGKIEEPEDFAEQAKNLISRVGPTLGYDMTYDPELPKTRKDVCAIRHMAENGSTYGYDTIYLVWKDKQGKIQYEELTDSRSTKDYLSVKSIEETADEIIVAVGDRKYAKSKKELGLK
jgi:hypothetical protein